MSNATVTLSPQQQTAVDFVTKSGGSGLITAVAGSGKTFTILEMTKELMAEIQAAICAFNTSIAAELTLKISDLKSVLAAVVNVGTVHRFGYKALRAANRLINPRRDKPSSRKIDWMMDNFRNPESRQIGVPGELRKFVRKTYNLARMTGAGITPEFPFSRQDKWYDLVDHFDLMDTFEDADGNLPIDADELMRQGCKYVVWLIKWGVELAMTTTRFDYEDMLYVPLRLGLRVTPYHIIFVDEAQDLNVTRRLLVKRMMAPGSRVIFVGDPHQAIYGFTGADAEAFNNIRKEFGCVDIPLTYSFRCAQSVVRFAQQWVSHIQAHPDAPEGLSPLDPKAVLTPTQIWQMNLSHEDAILCRNNAPLVEVFFDCLRHGIAARIEGGRDFINDMYDLIRRWSNIRKLSALRSKIEAYMDKVTEKAASSGKELKADKVADTCQAVLAIMDHLSDTGTVDDLAAKIKEMFGDKDEEPEDRTPVLTLTTIHKSKGREWKRVFWWGRNRFNPSPYARQQWQMDQEKNLCYVAATRAKLELYEVTVPAKNGTMKRAA
jgi:superfamily I DNA/RNA helicase